VKTAKFALLDLWSNSKMGRDTFLVVSSELAATGPFVHFFSVCFQFFLRFKGLPAALVYFFLGFAHAEFLFDH